MFKLSRYSVFVPIPSDKNYFLVKNYLSGAVVLVERKMKDIMESLHRRNNSVNWGESKKKLISEKIIVPKELNEEKYFKSIFDKKRLMPSMFSICLATTTHCNLACPYCCEKGITLMTMKPSIYQKVLDWYKDKLADRRINAFRLVLYGGEPLIDLKGIKWFVPRLKTLTDKKGIPFYLSLITNGTLLNKKTLTFLKQYGLDTVQITLDGPPHIHNQRRVGKNGKGTFWKIFENLSPLIGTVKEIVIRINFDFQNLKQIPLLLDLLAENNWQRKITLSLNATERIFPGEFCGQCFPSGSTELINGYVGLWKEAKRRNFSIPEVVDRGPCMSSERDQVVIGPKGKIYKCIEMMGNKNLSVGDVKQRSYKKNYSKYMEANYLNWCLEKTDCPLVPICAGGCRFQAYIKSGNSFKVDCQRDFLEKINAQLTLLRYSATLKSIIK